MQIVVNRIKYQLPETTNFRLVISAHKDLSFHMKTSYFKERHNEPEKGQIEDWLAAKDIGDETFISYGFSEDDLDEYLCLPFNQRFEYSLTLWLLLSHFKEVGFLSLF